MDSFGNRSPLHPIPGNFITRRKQTKTTGFRDSLVSQILDIHKDHVLTEINGSTLWYHFLYTACRTLRRDCTPNQVGKITLTGHNRTQRATVCVLSAPGKVNPSLQHSRGAVYATHAVSHANPTSGRQSSTEQTPFVARVEEILNECRKTSHLFYSMP